MNTIKSLLVILSATLILSSCKDDMFPSSVPTTPEYSYTPKECFERYFDLQVDGSFVEDDLTIEYRYYLSSDNKQFKVVNPNHIKFDGCDTYYWYATAVSVTKDGVEVAESTPTPVYTISVKKIEVEFDIDGEQYLEEKIDKKYFGYYGDTIEVPLKLVDGAYVDFVSNNDYLSSDSKKIFVVLDDDVSIHNVYMQLASYYSNVNIEVFIRDADTGIDKLAERVLFGKKRDGDNIEYVLPDKFNDYYISYEDLYGDGCYLKNADFKHASFVVDQVGWNEGINCVVILFKKQVTITIYKDDSYIGSVIKETKQLDTEYTFDFSEYCADGSTFDYVYLSSAKDIEQTTEGTVLKYKIKSFGENDISIFLKSKEMP